MKNTSWAYPIVYPAQEFGTRFHDFLLLDTETIPNGKRATAIRRMLDVLCNDPLFSRLLRLRQS
ncbi:hypothetical protein F5984_25405 [Rudanella paleaurantiibacter]|uniref:Uncharacterized protein n=1 Tax=Rudanella paleaurantiibacter TaxID=2614655 RepID=A0A7J5TU34_9BACT|nr:MULTISPECIES: hypothetical protein [Rudanella]KAB7725830.1 hypothetical protein F5984_25405 [Rudanella paleaurantiibacter]